MQPLTKQLSNMALDFLNSLNAVQFNKVAFPFDIKHRYEFEYRPLERTGLMLADMSDAQKAIVFKIIELTCSDRGAQLVHNIINLEVVLKEWEQMTANPSAFERSPDRYWLSIFGNPAQNDQPWGYQFSGHHIIINGTVKNGVVSALPLFLGTNPATIMHGSGKNTQYLKEESNFAHELLLSVPLEQRNCLVTSNIAPYDIVTRRYRDTTGLLVPDGISLNELESPSRELLVKTIKLYVQRMSPSVANDYWQDLVRQNFYNCQFVWAGSLNLSEPHYYAIHSKRFIIEYDRTQNQANHVHSVMRDRSKDWGMDLLGSHYQKHH